MLLTANLVVYDHHVVTVGAQPRVHGLTDAADLIQGRSMVVRPAEVQHLEERSGGGRQAVRGSKTGSQVTFKLPSGPVLVCHLWLLVWGEEREEGWCR